jgi:hypothetical protein
MFSIAATLAQNSSSLRPEPDESPPPHAVPASTNVSERADKVRVVLRMPGA